MALRVINAPYVELVNIEWVDCAKCGKRLHYDCAVFLEGKYFHKKCFPVGRKITFRNYKDEAKRGWYGIDGVLLHK